ncbi:TPA: 30S ribosomal protein S24e [Candidatus Bathyarchaeota archaeon]|nr:30S ribosomal protein S24e [Candidatus Bathyarchaeota archaeon]
MEIKITSVKENPLLKRKEVMFSIDHGPAGKTPGRLEVRKAIAGESKTNTELVFVQGIETKTGTSSALGFANIYESTEQAKRVEPEYIVERNNPKPKEEAKE